MNLNHIVYDVLDHGDGNPVRFETAGSPDAPTAIRDRVTPDGHVARSGPAFDDDAADREEGPVLLAHRVAVGQDIAHHVDVLAIVADDGAPAPPAPRATRPAPAVVALVD